MGTAVVPASASAASVTSLQAQASAIVARVNALDAQMARFDEQLDQVQTRLNVVNQQIAASQAAIGQAQGRIAASRSRLRGQAVAAYIRGGDVPSVQQLIQTNESLAVLRQSYIGTLNSNAQNTLDSLHLALADYHVKQSQLVIEQADALSAVNQVRAARNSSASAAAAESGALSQIKGQLAAQVSRDEANQAASSQQKAFRPVSGGSGASGGVSVSSSPPPPPGQGASTALAWARDEVGKPYVYGASGPNSFDCSGFIMYIWGKAGASLPHSAAGQWDDTTRVPMSQIQPGDLIFYYTPVDHVGIYIGNGQMIVADHTGVPVRYASIWRPGLDGAGRVN